MAYYSMYYALLALLFRIGIKCENHAAAIMLLQEIFGIDNARIRFAKEERIDKQYYVEFSVTIEEVQELIGMAEEFIVVIQDFLAKLGNADVERHRERFMELVGGGK